MVELSYREKSGVTCLERILTSLFPSAQSGHDFEVAADDDEVGKFTEPVVGAKWTAFSAFASTYCFAALTPLRPVDVRRFQPDQDQFVLITNFSKS